MNAISNCVGVASTSLQDAARSLLPRRDTTSLVTTVDIAEITNAYPEITIAYPEITNAYPEITNAIAKIANAIAKIANAIAKIANQAIG
ncbi:hypothetical protein [uncultured Nostoc sp.]|uniref:hypothetical protein n=1 Tax=uncultured Nostoc sp. TaxID=340711 RepID=UPI00260C9140|nr:hypothetical protein [uncultured Nostoc sp.]